MKHEFTEQFMQANCGCYSMEELYDCTFMHNKQILLIDIVNSEIPLRDKLWFVVNKAATADEAKQIALEAAELVLPIFEVAYPTDKAPATAIDAAKRFMKTECSLDELLYAINQIDWDSYYSIAGASGYAAMNTAKAYSKFPYHNLTIHFSSYAVSYAVYAATATDKEYTEKLLTILKSNIS